MQNKIQLSNGVELSRRDKERQDQRLLSYAKGCAERRTLRTSGK